MIRPKSNPLANSVSRFYQNLCRPYPYHWAVLLLALLASAPLWSGGGLLNTRGGGDSPFLLQRVYELSQALADGHFPARWMPNANYGYGYPFFHFYAPLSLYIAVFFVRFGFGIVRAIQMAQVAGFVVAAMCMFLLGQRWLHSDAGGFLAATAYTLAPFHLVNVLVRGDSLAEFWAMAFYPLTLLLADHLLEAQSLQPKRKIAAALAVIYAALILSHNISALIFTPFLGAFLAWRWLTHSRRWGDVAWATTAVGLALALAAWFFVPALGEQGLAQLGPVTQGYFHFSQHFRGLDLVQSSWAFNYDPNGGEAFKMGLLQAGLALAGLVCWFKYRRETETAVLPFLLLLLALATFMITPLSRFLWEKLPLLSFTQFPWRFLSVQAVGTSLAAGGLALLPFRRTAVPLLTGLLLLAAFWHLHPDYLGLTDSDISAEKLAQYEWFSGNIGTTVSAEYLPTAVQPRPVTSQWLTTGQRDTVVALQGTMPHAELLRRQATQQTWQIATTTPATLMFPTLFWPGWQATVDGRSAPLYALPSTGLIGLDVPAGSHAITLWLGHTPLRLAAELLSLTAVCLLVFLWGKPTRPQTMAAGQTLLILGVVSLVVHLWPASPVPGPLTWDFAQMAYLHHDTTTRFASGAELTAYTYNASDLVAGQTLTVSLTWANSLSVPLTLDLFTPAINRTPEGQPPQRPFASASGTGFFRLPIPADTPPGLYIPRLSGETAVMASGRTRGDLFLRPIRITSPQPAAGTTLTVLPGDVQITAPGVLSVPVRWFTPVPLAENSNFSLRLLSPNGDPIAQTDSQPGYGFLPTSGWSPGQWLNDRLQLTLPPLESGQTTPLLLELYRVSSGEILLARRLGTLTDGTFTPNTPVYDLPEGLTAVQANFAGLIALRGYHLANDATGIHLTLAWQALQPIERNVTRFVHGVALGADERPLPQPPLAQNDGWSQANSYPTSQWQVGEIVTEQINLPPLSGSWGLAIGFYESVDGQLVRLTAVQGNGSSAAPLPDNVLLIQPK